ncbi:MAG TPA: hypothetical protein DIC53_11855 [Synergistaceae bacterium]|jgi:uncharacterized protein YeaO (DUF488 family)|nr:hypothetical protein [Synergistaceae bacterium]
MDIRIKRVYDAPSPDDGTRIFVDRLWPRGISKERLAADLWLKGVTPSTELRTWFHKDKERFDEFRKHYLAELAMAGSDMETLRSEAEKGRITLLTAAKDEERNHVVVLKDYLLAAHPKTKRS